MRLIPLAPPEDANPWSHAWGKGDRVCLVQYKLRPIQPITPNEDHIARRSRWQTVLLEVGSSIRTALSGEKSVKRCVTAHIDTNPHPTTFYSSLKPLPPTSLIPDHAPPMVVSPESRTAAQALPQFNLDDGQAWRSSRQGRCDHLWARSYV
ncbi:hypothetical protein CPC08DRAFT_401638 [Agrocybe pediades]|nr:hypothetical protein CPC08DRAFT_401638 [Agrocybe pediades]